MFKGIDVSNHQEGINWSSVKNSGVQVAYVKATEGTYYKDPYAPGNYNGAKQNGIAVGFYHFLNGSANGHDQANYFYNYLKENNLLGYDLKLCVDVEVACSSLTDKVLDFINTIKNLTGQDCIIYTGPYFANSNLDNRVAGIPCWIAHYGVSTPMPTNIWGTNYAGHQYSSTGSVPGVNGNCDVDTFYDAVFLGQPNISGATQPTANCTPSVSPHDYLGTTHKRKFLQYCLNALGYNLTIDGLIGPKSIEAIKDFQSHHGLAVDGLVGNNTWNCIYSLMPTLRRGSKGNAVKCVQFLLSCNIDGDFGPATENAVRSFQKGGNGTMVVDGVVGPVTWGGLFGFCFK